MTTEPRPLDAAAFAIGHLRRITDPRERISAIRAFRAELARSSATVEALLVDTILELRALDTPATWQEIGDLLNVSAQRAYQLADRGTQPQPERTPR